MAVADTFIDISDDENAPADQEQWSTPMANAFDDNEAQVAEPRNVQQLDQPSRSASNPKLC